MPAMFVTRKLKVEMVRFSSASIAADSIINSVTHSASILGSVAAVAAVTITDGTHRVRRQDGRCQWK
eukprot:scaffold126150_cov60-Attheya_sp.AAC.18